MCKVSIIVPAYNSQEYIEKSICSIQKQSLTDWELIIIDDRSIDNTLEICYEKAKDDMRIRVVASEKNGGPSKARNLGIDLAKGEYIAFIDSDDTVEVAFLEKLVHVADRHKSDIVWCNYREVLSDTVIERKHGLVCNEVLDAKYAMSLFFVPQIGLSSLCNKLYKSAFINDNNLRINEERYHGEDWEFNLNAFKLKPKIVLIDDMLYNYNRVNSGSVVSSYHETDLDYFIKSIQMGESISKQWRIDYDSKHTNGKFVYNVISLLRKLLRSNHTDISHEWDRIIGNESFKRVLATNDYNKSLLPIRYKLYLFLIENRLSSIAAWLMRHE